MKDRRLLWICLIGPALAMHARGDDAVPKLMLAESHSAATELPLVKALAGEFKIVRGTEKDHLVLPGSIVLDGSFQGESMRLDGEPLPIETVAAIRGGGGQGRRAKVFLRDGTVRAGEVTFEHAEFASHTLGKLNLTAATLDCLILRRSDDDGRSGLPRAAYTMHEDGTVTALSILPDTPLRLRWAGGESTVPWDGISHIKPRPLPATAQDVTFHDGTRIIAWVFPPTPPGPFLAFAKDLTSLYDAAEKAASGLTESFVLTRDGSQWSGKWAEKRVHVNTSGAAVSLRTADISSAAAVGDGEFEIATRSGAVIQGVISDETLAWKTSVGVVALPWRLISTIGGPAK